MEMKYVVLHLVNYGPTRRKKKCVPKHIKV